MKRLIAVCRAGAGAAALILLAACGDQPEADTRQPGEMQTSWAAPARLETAVFGPNGVTLTGAAGPGDRIVLTDTVGVSVAATAGDDGVFSLRLATPADVSLYHAEIQSRGSQARAGEWLAITRGVDAVAAVLAPGAVVTPLNHAGLLSGVDYDGSAVLVSGAALPGEPVRVSLDDRPAQAVTVDQTGRYVARFASVPPGPRRFRVEAGERIQDVVLTLTAPPEALGTSGSAVATRIDWPTPGGGFQSSWILNTGDDDG